MNVQNMSERRSMDIAEVFSTFGNRVDGVNKEFIAEPHPRPTSAPPELMKITKEGLFAFPPAGYKHAALPRNDDFQLPHLPLAREDFVNMLNGKSAFSPLKVMEEPLKVLPRGASVSSMFDRQESLALSSNHQDETPDSAGLASLGKEVGMYNGSMDMFLNSLIYQSSFAPNSDNAATVASFSSGEGSSTMRYLQSKSVSNLSSTPQYYSSSAEKPSFAQYPHPGGYKPPLTRFRHNYNVQHVEHRESIGASGDTRTSVGHSRESITPPYSARSVHSKSIGGKNGGYNTNKSTVSSRNSSKKLSPRARVVPGMLSPEDLVTNDCYHGQVYLIARDQAGGRMLQRKLDELGKSDIQSIYDEVLDHVVELMTDPFGNYLCQKLMEVCSEEQKDCIIDRVSPELVQISLNLHGTRAVQKMIDVLHTPTQIEKVVQALRTSVVTLVKDLNGNHVIQKCLGHLRPEKCQFIHHAIAGHCYDVATHRHGCCVLQRCIDSANPSQKATLVKEVCQNSCELVQDPFGNYVVQYILKSKDPSIIGAVINRLSGSIVPLSKQKFSSNVVEACLTVGTANQKKQIIAELLKGEETTLKDLLLDAFGNYVVQRAFQVAQEPEFRCLVEAVRPYLDELHSSIAGKKVIIKMVKKYPQLSAVESELKNYAQQQNEAAVNTNGAFAYPPNLMEHAIFNDASAASHMSTTGNHSNMGSSEAAHGVSDAAMRSLPTASYRNQMVVDPLQQPVVLAEHMSPLHYAAPAGYGNGHASYRNTCVPPQFSLMLHRNGYQSFPPQGMYSPMSPHPQSPRFVSFHSPYNGATLFQSMSPLNLNTSFPMNAAAAGWASSYS